MLKIIDIKLLCPDAGYQQTIEAFHLCYQNYTHLYTKTCAAILEYSFIHGSINWKWTDCLI